METKLKKSIDYSSYILGFAILVTFFSLSITIYRNFLLDNKNAALENQNKEILKLKDKILYLDEVLTMSAMMAAQTGDEHWEKRYRHNLLQLDSVLIKMEKLAPSSVTSQFIASTDSANTRLVAMENRAFDFVRENKLENAKSVLSNEKYNTQKKIYKAGMDRLYSDINSGLGERQDVFYTSHFSELAVTGFVLLLLTIGWIFVYRFQNKTKTQLLNSVHLINESNRVKEKYIKVLTNTYEELSIAQDTVCELNEALEHKVLERTEELQLSQNQFKNLIENIPGIYWIMNLETYQGLYISPSYETLFDRKCESFYTDSSDFIQAVHPEDREELMKNYKKLNDLSEIYNSFRIIKPNGEIRWFSAKINMVYDAKGNKMAYGYSEDITERKIAEKALQKSETKFRTLFDTNGDAIVLMNEKGFIDCNPKAIKMFRVSSKEEFLKKQLLDLNPAQQSNGSDSVILATELIKKAMKTGRESFEWTALRIKTQKTFPCDMVLQRMEIDGQMVLQITVRDITERKKGEEKLKQQFLALENQNIQLNDFCHIISHNLRAPLVNIGLLVDFTAESTDKSERKGFLKQTKKAVKTINETFNELVDSIQVKNDLEIKSDKIMVSDSIKKAMATLKSEINFSEAEIEVNVSDCPVIHFPVKYMNSILFNLISNSLKYKSPDRKPIIKITNEKREGRVVLSVSDNGLGIDLKTHQNNLFKLKKVFHQHPDAKGFGLFMTKTQVDSMGGKIWAESTPDLGSTFFVEFVNQDK